jgi:hypothetical protein
MRNTHHIMPARKCTAQLEEKTITGEKINQTRIKHGAFLTRLCVLIKRDFVLKCSDSSAYK